MESARDVRRPLTRRQFARLLAGGSLVIAAGGLLAARPAAAGRTWCKTDPGLRIGGREAHINLYSYEEMFASATGPVQIIVQVPTGFEGKTQLLYMDNGFGYGYALSIKRNQRLTGGSAAIDIVVDAFAPAKDGTLPVKVEIVPVDLGKLPAFRQGYANRWISVKDQI